MANEKSWGARNNSLEKELVQELDVVEFYRISPWSGALIYREDASLGYMPVEPLLVENEAKLLSILREYVPRVLKAEARLFGRGLETTSSELERAAQKVLGLMGLKLDQARFGKLMYYLRRDFIGMGPIDVMINDPFVEDITCAGAGSHVYVYHRKYSWLKTTVIFEDPEELLNFTRRLAWKAGQDLVYANPIVEGPLPPKQYRAHLTLEVVSIRGSTFTVRKGAEAPFTLPMLVRLGTLSPEIAAYLWLLVSNMLTILVAGPMASGKTSLLNAIAMLIPPQKKIVTVEEVNEIRLFHENWTPMVVRESRQPGVANVTLYDLLKSSLRQRPDYIIVGEIRGEEAYTFFQAIAVGHGGLGTIHGDSYEHVIRRLENPPMNVSRQMIGLLNAVAVMRSIREETGTTRRLFELVEVLGYDPERNLVRSSVVARYDPYTQKFSFRTPHSTFAVISARSGLSEEKVIEDFNRRVTIMKWLAGEGIISPEQLSGVLREFHEYPERVYDRARGAGYA
ncbi:MAG: type II/IV secretion system ATPase subunit [Fervidicoccaceae archaeon]